MANSFAVAPVASRLGVATPAIGRPSPARAVVKAKPSFARAARTPVVTRASTYVCIDCGYIVSDFEKLPGNYKCPVCNAPKRRFKPYSGGGGNDPKTMKKRMQEIKNGGGSASSGGSDANGAVAIVAGGAVLLAALYFGLSATYN